MRKLLNTLYVMTESCYLSLDGENIVIQDGEKTLGRFPLHTLENIICFTELTKDIHKTGLSMVFQNTKNGKIGRAHV